MEASAEGFTRSTRPDAGLPPASSSVFSPAYPPHTFVATIAGKHYLFLYRIGKKPLQVYTTLPLAAIKVSVADSAALARGPSLGIIINGIATVVSMVLVITKK